MGSFFFGGFEVFLFVMKILLDWLLDYIDLNEGVTLATLAKTLIDLGHEVDGVDDRAAAFNHVVVGKILDRVPHPNADKLGVCTVDVGEAAPRTIVCGAPNARAGITVAVALPGAELAGGFKIASTDKRGIVSDGMICSVAELGLGDDHDGIWEMDDTLPAATPLTDVVKPDVILDVAVTPNRGDALSHLGLARDLAAAGLGVLKDLDEGWEGTTAPALAVKAGGGCPVMMGMEMRGVSAMASPEFIQRRLRAVGVKPRNILVDATNYVMLAVGQPLHAYDADKLKHGIFAAQDYTGEYTDLMGETWELAEGDIVIRDGEGGEVLGLGGIVGGGGCEVTATTTRIFMEGALFDRAQISLTGQRLSVLTDARSRNERGLDPALRAYSVTWAMRLIAEACGLDKSALSTLAVDGTVPAAGTVIAYAPSYFTTLIGMDVPAARQQEVLEALGFTVVVKGEDAWDVTAPAGRTFMETPEDLTEEILRVVGYETVPPVMPTVLAGQHEINSRPVVLDRLARKALALNGLTEVMNYSFIRHADAVLCGVNEDDLVVLDNPLVDTMQVMRPSLVPGLLRALMENVARRDGGGRLGEVGKVFGANGKERLTATGVVADLGERHWRGVQSGADVFVAKGLGEAVLTALDAPLAGARVIPDAGALYHPGKSGVWQVGPMTLGRFGELHPAVLKALDVDVPVAVFELDVETLMAMKGKTKAFTANPYPPVGRDVAFVVDKTVTADTLVNVIRKTGKTLVRDVSVFDVYAGKGVPEGKKSVALGMTLQAPDRTLTTAEIDGLVADVIAAAAGVGAVLRS